MSSKIIRDHLKLNNKTNHQRLRARPGTHRNPKTNKTNEQSRQEIESPRTTRNKKPDPRTSSTQFRFLEREREAESELPERRNQLNGGGERETEMEMKRWK